MGTPVTEQELERLLRTARRSAFRLETRDHYALGYEARDYERFLAGSPVPPPELDWWRPWLDQIAAQVKEGKQLGRVRILAEPPTDYQRWELWAAPWHARAGEQIAYMPRSKARKIGLPDTSDWWLIDDEKLIIMRFDAEGRITGKTLYTDTPTLKQHRKWRDLAVRNATPAKETSAA
jgi:hypothetical protein